MAPSRVQKRIDIGRGENHVLFQTMFSAVVAEEVGRVTVVVAGFGSLGAEVTLAASRL